MDVVRGATDRQSVSSAISGDAAEVTPKPIGFGDLWPPVFRAKDAVHQDFGVSVGHAETLFAGVIGVGDSSHRRECRRSPALLAFEHAAGRLRNSFRIGWGIEVA